MDAKTHLNFSLMTEQNLLTLHANHGKKGCSSIFCITGNAPYQKTWWISEIFFNNRYDDSVYSLHFFKWLGVGQTFKNKVESVSRGLGLSNKSDEVSPAAWVCMYDNLTKAHSTYSVVFGGTQTHTVELISMDMQSQNPNYVQINNIKRAVMSFVCGLRIEMLGH